MNKSVEFLDVARTTQHVEVVSLILNMITVICRFAHGFKIMRIPQPEWTDVILPRNAQYICSSRGGEIKIAYIHWIDGKEHKAFELWALSEDKIREVHPFARVQISNDFTEDNFYSHFFNAR